MIENESAWELSSIQTQDHKTLKSSDTCVILHLYYPEMWEEIRSYLSHLGGQFDLYVTIPYEVDISETTLKAEIPNARIYRCENRGRDIAPFLRVFSAISELNYKYICKIHTKKSVHIGAGKEWQQDMMDKLLGSPETIANIKQAFDTHTTWGLIGPQGHVVPHIYYWAQNSEKVLHLAHSIDIPTDNIEFSYVAGSMFWFRPQALNLLLNPNILTQSFEPEQGQQDGTLAHAFERFFGMVSNYAGYKIAESDSREVKIIDQFSFHFGLLAQEFEKQVQAVQTQVQVVQTQV
ncbi:MAG TPA: rhamnan synthesis F family protein, partial [Anaerolineales bacterium]|nr:rhamnan synthesis F family protein [Anaerolineales bacterium]